MLDFADVMYGGAEAAGLLPAGTVSRVRSLITPVAECCCGRAWTLIEFRELRMLEELPSGLPGIGLEIRECDCCQAPHQIHVDANGERLTHDQIESLEGARHAV